MVFGSLQNDTTDRAAKLTTGMAPVVCWLSSLLRSTPDNTSRINELLQTFVYTEEPIAWPKIKQQWESRQILDLLDAQVSIVLVLVG